MFSKQVLEGLIQYGSYQNYKRHSFDLVGLLKMGIVQCKLLNAEFQKNFAKHFGLMKK